jgi:hypothetical protein
MSAVSDLQRTVAKYLVWIRNGLSLIAEMLKCPYCKSPIANDASICANCHQV